MSLDLTSEINEMISERNMSEEQVISLIQDMIRSAYKKKFGTDENCLIEFDDSMRKMSVYQIRKVVKEEDWYSEFTEIPVEDAIELTGSSDIAEGDEVKILLDPKNFESASVQSAKQRGQQIVKEYFNDKIYADNKRKEGKLIYGEIKRRKDNGDYAVNIGLDIEASFPLRSQSPRETYSIQQKYKFLVERVEKAESAAEPRRGRQKDRERGVRIFLTRSSKDFVRALVENEVPEIASGDVEIKSIARQAGVRTKIAVDTRKSDVDPVGAVVGAKGLRIQAVMTECEGEKIDIIRYSEDPLALVANALIPAQVQRVVVIDPASKHIVAIVDDNQLGIAIGQGGVNVKLAKMLCDWNIEVKTPSQFAEMEQTQKIYENVEDLFKRDDTESSEEVEGEHKYTNEDIGIAPDDTPISDIGLEVSLVEKLQKRDIWSVEEFFEYSDDELRELGFTDEEIQEVRSVVVIEEDDEYSFECPNCHSILPAGTTKCPNCGVEFEFE